MRLRQALAFCPAFMQHAQFLDADVVLGGFLAFDKQDRDIEVVLVLKGFVLRDIHDFKVDRTFFREFGKLGLGFVAKRALWFGIERQMPHLNQVPFTFF